MAVTAAWARRELRRPTHRAPRFAYLASTAALLVVLAIDPLTGLVAYVGAHAAEHVLVVRWRIGRSAQRVDAGDRVSALARHIGIDGTIVLYAALVTTLAVGLRILKGSDVVLTVVLNFGALPILYDGFIWRSPAPRPAPASGPGA